MSKFIWTDRAKQQLRAIDRESALAILRALSDYAGSGQGQIKKLKGSGDLRLRVGDYRVRFEMADEDTLSDTSSWPSQRGLQELDVNHPAVTRRGDLELAATANVTKLFGSRHPRHSGP